MLQEPMSGEAALTEELARYRCLCYYPSSGTDLGDLDFFCSGKLLWGERTADSRRTAEPAEERVPSEDLPDLFVHTDISFYQEFAAGDWIPTPENGMHGKFDVVAFRELPTVVNPNRIWTNLPHSGKCFEYKLQVWDSSRPVTLIFCLTENEWFVANILLAHGIRAPFVWSKSWAGGRTYGTWLANVLDKLQTRKLYTDWLCLPGQRGEPRNRLVEAHYPELMTPATVRLVRNEALHWIDEGSHGWVEEFDVLPTG